MSRIKSGLSNEAIIKQFVAIKAILEAQSKRLEVLEKRAKRNHAVVFSPPTLKIVSEYAKENGYKLDPEAFMNHYTSNGWMVGKVKMKDWKASVRNFTKDKSGKIQREVPKTKYCQARKLDKEFNEELVCSQDSGHKGDHVWRVV